MKIFLKLLSILALTCLPARAQIQHVQTNATSCPGGSSSCTLTMKVPSNPGDTINFGVDWDGTVTVTSVTDDHGNIWAPSPLGLLSWSLSSSAEAFSVSNIKADATLLKVKVQMTGPIKSFFELYASEYSGLGTVPVIDGKAAATGNGIKLDSGPLNTTTSGDLIWCYGVSASAVGFVGKGFNSRSTFHNNIVEDSLNAPAGANNCTATSTSAAWVIQGLALKPATDTSPPQVSITSPVSGITIAGMYNVVATATDNVAVQSVQLQVDGTNLGGPFLQSPYTTAIDTIPLVNGPHTITAIAIDTSGNSATASSNVIVSNQPVTFSMVLKYDDGTSIPGSVVVSRVNTDGSLGVSWSWPINPDGTVSITLTVDPQVVYNVGIMSNGAFLPCDQTKGLCPNVNLLTSILLSDVTKFSGGSLTLTLAKIGNFVKQVQVSTTFNF